ncbi:hypothetical protein SERN_0539 [Serinibacter arcticus]|uniref:Uncharacterized protein n=1 Tax=Serinibacter arcticus TaxID=1655435 RepID=A0A4Z1EA05_9MICO|nr:hypothetical protein SERN_0539 [Serinibacter arcticus]
MFSDEVLLTPGSAVDVRSGAMWAPGTWHHGVEEWAGGTGQRKARAYPRIWARSNPAPGEACGPPARPSGRASSITREPCVHVVVRHAVCPTRGLRVERCGVTARRDRSSAHPATPAGPVPRAVRALLVVLRPGPREIARGDQIT